MDACRHRYPARPAKPAFDFTQIDANLNAGTVDGDVAAHRALSELYWQHPELRPQLYERIDQTAKRIYFQPQPHYFAEYNVQPGETLQAIAKKYSVSWEYLERLNKIRPLDSKPDSR
ncbi:MAG: LysM domain-containing protein [Planctomycetaceae bacterium]